MLSQLKVAASQSARAPQIRWDLHSHADIANKYFLHVTKLGEGNIFLYDRSAPADPEEAVSPGFTILGDLYLV